MHWKRELKRCEHKFGIKVPSARDLKDEEENIRKVFREKEN